MRFGVLKETEKTETRVALVPETIKLLAKKGHQLAVEKGAGANASISDDEFRAAGAEVLPDTRSVAAWADCILKIQPPSDEELFLIPDGKAIIGFLWVLRNPDVVRYLTKKRLTAFSMDAIPRITRAQNMDALSSMATIAGYKAVLLGANHLPKFLPMLTTAAGTIRPAQTLIIGAGVAGLQAIATARRLGAIVEAFDMRPAVKEQVQSLGARFVEVKDAEQSDLQSDLEDKHGYAKQASAELLAKQQALIQERVKLADLIITTAQVPGKPAPRLITADTVRHMKPGSVIVDLAAETGGNCDLTQTGHTIVDHGVTIIGPVNLSASMPLDASRMYAKNIVALINDITNDKGFTFDWTNEVFAETCITFNGETNQRRSRK